jgi:hypothetical protein
LEKKIMKNKFRLWLVPALVALLFSSVWSIGSEGRKPGERPGWWGNYDNVAPSKPEPVVEGPKGDVPVNVDEAVTRNIAPTRSGTLVITPSGETAEKVPAIDGEQVVQEATRDPGDGKPLIWRTLSVFAGFLLAGGACVMGLFRWLNNQAPPPTRRTRRKA